MFRKKSELAVPERPVGSGLEKIPGENIMEDLHPLRKPTKEIQRQLNRLSDQIAAAEPMEVVGMRTTDSEKYNPYGAGVVDRSKRAETGAADINMAADNTRSGSRRAAQEIWKRPSQIPMDRALDADLDPELNEGFKPGDIERAA